MIKTFSFLFVSSFFIMACHSAKDEKQLAAVIAGFNNSSAYFEENNNRLLLGLESRVGNTYGYSNVEAALEKAASVCKLAMSTTNYIKNLKKKERVNTGELFDSLFACRTAMIKAIEPEGEKLTEMIKYNIQVLRDSIPLLAGLTDSSDTAIISFRKDWVEANTMSSSKLMRLALLSKMQNDLLISSNILTAYCYQLMNRHYSCFPYELIATLSPRNVKQGEEVEIFAGMSVYDPDLNPKITIDGVLINDALASRTLKAKGKPGKRTIPNLHHSPINHFLTYSNLSCPLPLVALKSY